MSKLKPAYSTLVTMLDTLCACVETGIVPQFGSPCHRTMRVLVAESGCAPKRKRRRLPPLQKNGGGK